MKLMTRRHSMALLVCFSFLPVMVACSGADETALDATTAELAAMLHAFLAHSDTAAAHEIFWAEDLVYTSSNGTRFGKADIMQGFADTVSDEETTASVVYSGEDVHVRVFGDAAVVTFRLLGTPADGATAAQYFNTGTFIRRAGTWRAVAWQATAIPAAE